MRTSLRMNESMNMKSQKNPKSRGLPVNKKSTILVHFHGLLTSVKSYQTVKCSKNFNAVDPRSFPAFPEIRPEKLFGAQIPAQDMTHLIVH